MSGIIYDPPRVLVPIFNNYDYTFLANQLISQANADSRYLYRVLNDTASGRINFAGGMRMPTRVFPPVVMTSLTTPAGYVASSSSVFGSFDASNVFRYSTTSFFASATSTYNASGDYIGAVSTTITTPPSTYLGEWLQIQLPSPILLKQFYIFPRTAIITTAPNIFTVLGSNDGSTWVQLFNNTVPITYAVSSGFKGLFFSIVSPTNAYSYYRMVINKVFAGGTSVQFSQWILFDTDLPYSLYYTAENSTGLLAYPNADINFNNTMYVNSSILSSLPVRVPDSGTTLTNNSTMGMSRVAPNVMRLGTNVPISLTSLAQTPRNYYGMTTNTSNGDVYVCVRNGFIYKFVGGTGNLVAAETTPTSRNWIDITYNRFTGNVYASVIGGDIYMQTAGTGDFIALGQTTRSWGGMTSNPANGDVYCCVYSGDIYRQTAGIGNFIALGQTIRTWYGMTVLRGNIYACVDNGDIYRQIGGAGAFTALGQTTRKWGGMATINNDVYCVVEDVADGNVYIQYGGEGNFISLNQTTRAYHGITSSNNVVYVSQISLSGQIYSSPLNPPEMQLVATNATTSEHYAEAQRFLHTSGFTSTVGSFGWTFVSATILRFFQGGTLRSEFTDTINRFNNQNLDMKANNLVNASQVGNSAGNLEVRVNNAGSGGSLTLTGGTGLLAATSGGSAGQHLVITINGVNYKIALQTV